MLKYSWIREGPAGVCIFLHGRAGDYKVMSAFSSLVPSDFGIVCLQAPFDDPEGGFSWWLGNIKDKTDDLKRQQILQSLSLIDDFLDSLSAPLYLAAGFSQGSAILSAVIQRKPNYFKAVALLSGFFVEITKTSFHNPTTSVFVTHGTTDTIVPVARGKESYDKLLKLGFDAYYLETDTGHKVAASAIRELKGWFLNKL